jgi:RNA polymerase sigma-70 factor (ECF subfamily)
MVAAAPRGAAVTHYSRAMQHVLSREDAQLVDGLRARDEAAFAALIRMYGAGMLRVARMYVSSRAVAEEVVQEAWLAVLKGIDRFEGRSSLKTWLFRIVANVAKTRGVREARSAPFSSFANDESTVSPERFLDAGERFPGHWAVPPASWAGIPEDRLLATETMDLIRCEIDRLPPSQRAVLELRDIEGLSADEVCNALELTETNGRVLLHRARARVRAALEEYLA